jgi:hypothetical protein
MDTKIALKNELGKILQSTSAQWARAIIDSDYTREILEQLSPQETYMIIKESWGTDSQILLPYVPPETVCHCIDMDCWEGDTLTVGSILDWLWEIYNSSLETLQEVLQTMDLDIIILLYQSYIDVVQVVPTDETIADLLDEGYESFDDIYYFMFQEEDEKTQLLKDMLSLIFTHFQNVYYSIMEGVMWELRSSMEESIYERRSLRLMEMGFPPPDEAMSIYQRVQSKKLLGTGINKSKVPILDRNLELLPAIYLEHLAENTSLVASSMSEASPEERQRFTFEMIYLANKVVMADYRPLNEVDTLKSSIEKASSVTSLGLAVAMREQGRTAPEVIAAMNAETLFSLGFNMIVEQKSRLKQVLAGIDASMIPDRLGGFVEGLMKKRPLYKDEDFSRIEQLEEVTRNIDRIMAMIDIMERLGWENGLDVLEGTNTGADIDMEAVILTSLAINSLTGENAFRPLSHQELGSFVKLATRLDASGMRTLVPELEPNLAGFLKGIEPTQDEALMEDIAGLLGERFEEEISGIRNMEDLDPRFITCFVVRL